MTGVGALFVYGTLKQGESNYRHIAQFVDSVQKGCTVRGTLYDLGPYPAFVTEGEQDIHGELLVSRRLDALLRITDAIEGDEYERVKVEVRAQSGQQTAWVYCYSGNTTGLRRIDAGVWRPAQARRETT